MAACGWILLTHDVASFGHPHERNMWRGEEGTDFRGSSAAARDLCLHIETHRRVMPQEKDAITREEDALRRAIEHAFSLDSLDCRKSEGNDSSDAANAQSCKHKESPESAGW